MKKLLIILFVFAFIAGSTFLWWKNGLLPVNKENKTQKIFVIPKGAPIREIANKLKKEELIRDPIVFFLLVKQMGLDQKIQAGDFRLSPSQSTQEIAQNLTVGTLDIWITIPEGKRAEEIADILKEKIPSYQTPWKVLLSQSEGYLFPDTYLIPKDAPIEIIISQMRNNFEKKFATLDTSQTNLSKEQIVIIASLIEREARYEKDRPLVASVILNRLKQEMKLDIDATIQYALGYQPSEKTWWKKNLTFEDLKLDSPYNTYTNAGLPKTPICNPGFQALQAVVNPAQTDYLFYVSDSLGHNHYAKTNAEHNENIRKYNVQ